MIDFGIASFEVKLVNITDIVMTPFNPSSRTEEQDLKKLKADIAVNGIVSPPVCEIKNDKYHLADGNRRITCLKLLNYKKVPIIVRESSQSVAQVFASANGFTKSISSANQLEIWSKENNAVNNTYQKKFANLTDEFSLEFLQTELIDRKLPPSRINLAMAVAKYIGDNSTERVKSVLTWMTKYNLNNSVNMWIRNKMNPLHVKYCLLKDIEFVSQVMMGIGEEEIQKKLNEEFGTQSEEDVSLDDLLELTKKL